MYLCGSYDQKPLADLTELEHKGVHSDIASIRITVDAAEKSAYIKLGKRRVDSKGIVLKIAQTDQGRTAIANALEELYTTHLWMGVGNPISIGIAFPQVKPKYISGEETSLPWCTRNGNP